MSVLKVPRVNNHLTPHSFSLFGFLQILNPNPDAMSKMITENASEEFLHSLSNYCALQVRTEP